MGYLFLHTHSSRVQRPEVDSITGVYTEAKKTMAASIGKKSAITAIVDHVRNENHVNATD